MKKLWKRTRMAIGKVCLVDRVLILFMAVLLSYMAFHLFDGTVVSQDTNTIDIVVRTSASAIFGYFISVNFLKADSSDSTQSTKPSQKTTEQPIEEPPASTAYGSSVQVIVVSAIGVISLILLLIARSFAGMTPEFAATVSQLRDFVATCVGFLVSCGKKSGECNIRSSQKDSLNEF